MWDSEPDPTLEELLDSLIGQLQDLNKIQNKSVRDEVEYCLNIKSLIDNAELWVQKIKQANDWRRELRLIKADLPMIQNIHSAIVRASRRKDFSSRQRIHLSQMALCMELLPVTPFDFSFKLDIYPRTSGFEDSLDCRIANDQYESDAGDIFSVRKTIKFSSQSLSLSMKPECGDSSNEVLFEATTSGRTDGFFPHDPTTNTQDWAYRIIDHVGKTRTHIDIEGWLHGDLAAIQPDFEAWDYFSALPS